MFLTTTSTNSKIFKIICFYNFAAKKKCKEMRPGDRPGPMKARFSREELDCKEFSVCQ